MLWLFVLSLAVVWIGLQGVTKDGTIRSLEARVLTLESNLAAATAIQVEDRGKVIGLSHRLDADEHVLNRYSTNTTSNADLEDEIVLLRSYVMASMAYLGKNVSADVDERMAGLTHEMQRSEERVMSAKKSVDDNIHEMRASINATSDKLQEAVDSATALIHDEVLDVKDTMEAYVVVTNHQFAAENDFVKYQLAGTFTLIGSLISFWHLTGHLRNLHKPDVQRRILAILWMVPIYGISSWLSMVLTPLAPVLELIRDCYEAYAIHTFVAFLMAILEDGMGLQSLVLKLTAQAEAELEAGNLTIKPPTGMFYDPNSPSSIALNWLYQCKLLTLQFVVMKPLLALVPYMLRLIGHDTSQGFVDENG